MVLMKRARSYMRQAQPFLPDLQNTVKYYKASEIEERLHYVQPDYQVDHVQSWGLWYGALFLIAPMPEPLYIALS